DLSLSSLRHQRRSHVLWEPPCRRLSASRVLCGSHPAGCPTGRPAGAGADQVRARDKPPYSGNARSHGAANHANDCRRGDRVNRRAFVTLLGGAATWPLAAGAQQGERMRRIGLLMGTSDDQEGQARVTALKQGLQELGWTDGRNIQIETRFGGADAG